jgi:hypothetical protein
MKKVLQRLQKTVRNECGEGIIITIVTIGITVLAIKSAITTWKTISQKMKNLEKAKKNYERVMNKVIDDEKITTEEVWKARQGLERAKQEWISETGKQAVENIYGGDAPTIRDAIEAYQKALDKGMKALTKEEKEKLKRLKPKGKGLFDGFGGKPSKNAYEDLQKYERARELGYREYNYFDIHQRIKDELKQGKKPTLTLEEKRALEKAGVKNPKPIDKVALNLTKKKLQAGLPKINPKLTPKVLKGKGKEILEVGAAQTIRSQTNQSKNAMLKIIKQLANLSSLIVQEVKSKEQSQVKTQINKVFTQLSKSKTQGDLQRVAKQISSLIQAAKTSPSKSATQKQVLNQVLCPTGQGKGEISCPNCGGKGVVVAQCNRCEGTGVIKGHWRKLPFGSMMRAFSIKPGQKVKGTRLPNGRLDPNEPAWAWEPGKQCDQCGGKGGQPETCNRCQGGGNITCPTCQGKGLLSEKQAKQLMSPIGEQKALNQNVNETTSRVKPHPNSTRCSIPQEDAKKILSGESGPVISEFRGEPVVVKKSGDKLVMKFVLLDNEPEVQINISGEPEEELPEIVKKEVGLEEETQTSRGTPPSSHERDTTTDRTRRTPSQPTQSEPSDNGCDRPGCECTPECLCPECGC